MLTLPAGYPEILADLADLFHRRLTDRLDPPAAADLALDLAEAIRLKWGGGLIYIPKGDAYERRGRDATIWREFDGRNHADLARRFNLTLSCVYDILARERKRRQHRLFGD